MKSHGKWMIRLGVVLLAVLWISIIAASWSDASEKESQAVDEEYQFSWLDPDKKIYVLQNRRYSKENRGLLSLMVGSQSGSPYRTTFTLDPRVSYFWAEDFGVEAFFQFGTSRENDTYRSLSRTTPNALPTVREVRSQAGILFQWLPWYAKINVFNSILYFDWYLSAGFGSMQTRLDTRRRTSDPAVYIDKNLVGYFLGTGHQYHLGERWIARLDYLASIYRAPVDGLIGGETWFSNHTISLGLGIKL
jgi:outer membrane beta-barrel protein